MYNDIDWLKQPVQPLLGEAGAHPEAVIAEDRAHRDVLLPLPGALQQVLRVPQWRLPLLAKDPR